ncbi:ImmA/IrrE family metallo-endopeptidase [Sphaerisporangium sp. NPDC051017]|uniref:ImmA/IrrE family metallo-endopeptidase n=1 Tax=Sphaerisporangium sp. NPDC051017 TaxID=3154636 RepID=UPI0034162BAB
MDDLGNLLKGGGGKLSLSDLVTAADILDVPVTYLTGQSSGEGNLAVSLRLGQAQESGVPVQALQYADMLLRQLRLLDLWQGPQLSVLDGLGLDHSHMRKEAGQRSAGKVRDALALGDQPIHDLVQLVEDCAIPVAFQPLPENIHGINVRDERGGEVRRVIIVNACDYWTRQRFTLAHELCHGLYDDDGQIIINEVTPPDTLPEVRAESFARYLLLPSEALASEVKVARTEQIQPAEFTARLMLTYGVSRHVVFKALVEDGHVPAGDTRFAILEKESIKIQMARAGLDSKWDELCERQHEPSGSPRLVERAVRAYGEGLVDIAIVAELLGEDKDSVAQRLAEAGW